MAEEDAEMPSHHALREEVDKIAKHLHTLRKDIGGVNWRGTPRRAGIRPNAPRMRRARRWRRSRMPWVKRKPTETLGIALGIGFLVGIILRR